MPEPAKIVAILTARPGKELELEALLLELRQASRREPGNLRWDVWRDVTAPGRLVLDELYLDEAAVAAHRATPHFEAYVRRVGDLADRLAVVSRPVAVGESSPVPD